MGLNLHKRHCARAVICLALVLLLADTAFGQRTAKKSPGKAGTSASKSARAKGSDRAKTADRDAPASDKIVLKDGKELLGQIVDGSSGSIVVARREWLKTNLSDRMAKWEEAERTQTGMAREQRYRRLQAWRQERPSVAAPGDRITPWLDRELSKAGGSDTPPILMVIQLGKGEATSVQKRGDQAARALRAAWILGLPEPEASPLATLTDSIAGRGTTIEADDPVYIDSLLPPAIEADDRWLLRRAATEVLNDEGLRYIRFGNTVLPEPVPGQAPDPTLGPKLVEGTIKDVLTGGRVDPLPDRLRSVADRGRVGMMVTRIDIAADFSAVAGALQHRAAAQLAGVSAAGAGGDRALDADPRGLAPRAGDYDRGGRSTNITGGITAGGRSPFRSNDLTSTESFRRNRMIVEREPSIAVGDAAVSSPRRRDFAGRGGRATGGSNDSSCNAGYGR